MENINRISRKITAALIAMSMLFPLASCTTTKVPAETEETTTTSETTTEVIVSEETEETEESRPVLSGPASERIEKVLVDHNFKFMADINDTLSIEDSPSSLENLHQGMYATATDFEDPYCQIKGTYLLGIIQLEDKNQLRVSVTTFDNEADVKTAYEARLKMYRAKFHQMEQLESVLGEAESDNYHQWASEAYDYNPEKSVLFHGGYGCYIEGNSVIEYMHIDFNGSSAVTSLANDISAAIGYPNPLDLAK